MSEESPVESSRGNGEQVRDAAINQLTQTETIDSGIGLPAITYSVANGTVAEIWTLPQSGYAEIAFAANLAGLWRLLAGDDP